MEVGTFYSENGRLWVENTGKDGKNRKKLKVNLHKNLDFIGKMC